MLGASALLGFAFLRDLEWSELARSKEHLVAASLLLLASVRSPRLPSGGSEYGRTATPCGPMPSEGPRRDGDARRVREGLLARGEIDEPSGSSAWP